MRPTGRYLLAGWIPGTSRSPRQRTSTRSTPRLMLPTQQICQQWSVSRADVSALNSHANFDVLPPSQIWGTNYARLASQTVFTLFYGGRDFAPKCIIDGINIQDWLQNHHNDAMMRLADRIREAGDLLDECVIGWDSMNEPGEGMIGLQDLSSLPKSQALK